MGLDEMKADTTQILIEWKETLTVKRLVDPEYDAAGKANRDDDQWTQQPDDSTTITGDWQELPGSAITEEQGREIKSNAQVIAAHDVDVEEGDRIYREDDSYMYVNYILNYEDHCTIRLTKMEVS